MRTMLAAALFAVLPASAGAQETACGDLPTQMDMNECAGRQLQTADAELNRLYAEIRERLSGAEDRRILLRDAQRAWTAFRDGDCAFRASTVAGGSVQPMMEAGCRTELTTRRIADFEAYLACEEGDLACPVPAN